MHFKNISKYLKFTCFSYVFCVGGFSSSHYKICSIDLYIVLQVWNKTDKKRYCPSETTGGLSARWVRGQDALSRFRVYVPSTWSCLGAAVACGKRSENALVQSRLASWHWARQKLHLPCAVGSAVSVPPKIAQLGRAACKQSPGRLVRNTRWVHSDVLYSFEQSWRLFICVETQELLPSPLVSLG